MNTGDYPSVGVRKSAGRPKLAERQELVSARLPRPIYDRLCRVAMARDTTVSNLVRALIVLRLPKDGS